MNIHELFEAHFASMHDVLEETVRMHRMSNGSYSLPGIARDFRCFKAGLEANSGANMQVLGFLSAAGVLGAQLEKCATFKALRTDTYFVPVYVKQCDSHKTGDE